MTMASPLSHTFWKRGSDRSLIATPSAGYDRRRHGIHNLQRADVVAAPTRYYDAITELGPLFYDQVGRVWVCAGYQESVQILTDSKTFSSARPHEVSQLSERGFASVSGIAGVLAQQLLFTDPPDHSTIRSAIAKEFTPAAVDTRDSVIRSQVDQCLDSLPRSGDLDIVGAFAEQLPTRLIASLLDVEDYASQLPSWADAYERLIGSLSTLPHIKDQSILPVLEEARAVMRSVAEQRLKQPGADVLSRLVHGAHEVASTDVALDSAAANALVMVAGGYQTLTHLVSNGLLLLDAHPEQQQLVRADPSLTAAAVNEIMRLEGSSQYVARRARVDTVIGGKPIGAGETVIVLLAAANLDARQFPEPHDFDVRRSHGRHLGFGRGRHYCIGAPYAERMAIHAINGFLSRYPTFGLSRRPDAVSWGPHANTRCPQHVWVELCSSPLDSESKQPRRRSDTERERFLLDQWNDTTVPVGPWRWHELFEQQARACPDSVAVECGGQTFSYEVVDRLANGLAHDLRHRGVEPESVVAIVMDRSATMVIAMLAVAKAGGAFLLADANCPSERLTVMVDESSARWLLTDASNAVMAQAVPATTIVVDLSVSADMPPVTGVHQGNTAYVVFTSGTTGRPKGIAISHEGVVNLHRAQRDVFRPGSQDRVLQFLSPSWDGCVFEVVMALLCGATLVVVPSGQLVVGPPLLRMLKQHRITIMTCTPAVWAALPNDPLPDLRIAAAAGERLPAKTVAKWKTSSRRFLNLYGPAEAAVWSSWHECDGTEDDPPIGRPIANRRLYVLDSQDQPVAIGEEGELVVAGLGIGRYIARSELMEKSFAVDPHAPGQTLYRTGDICRWREDGVLEYRGRRDRQTKIRGQRVELDEVEKVLETAPGVVACVVEAKDGRLVARVVTDNNWDEKAIRNWMSKRLHSGMVPAAYDRVEQLPRTLNGKVAGLSSVSIMSCGNVTSNAPLQRTMSILPAAGPARDTDRLACGNVTSPPPSTTVATRPSAKLDINASTRRNVTSSATVTALTWKVARMYAACLSLPQASVKATSDFFDIGGDSLTVAEFLTHLERETEVALDIEALLLAPTPATIAELIAATHNKRKHQ